MTKIILATILSSLFLLSFTLMPQADAAVDMFLKIEGVDGESADSKHTNEIDILSYSFGASQSGAGKVTMQDFHFVMKVNKASPKLFQACASGEHLKSAVVTMRVAGKSQLEFMTFKFTDVMISSYQTSGGGSGSDVPVEEVSLNFAKIEMEYKPIQKDGKLGSPVKYGWDVKANKKI